MTQSDALRPYGSEYDSFLYEYVGEDRNGILVTVLSTFARLGVDPWEEASELARLPEEAARTRLDARIATFRDVPALAEEHNAISRRLIALLPRRTSAGAAASRGFSPAHAHPGPARASSRRPPYLIATVLVIVATILIFISLNAGG